MASQFNRLFIWGFISSCITASSAALSLLSVCTKQVPLNGFSLCLNGLNACLIFGWMIAATVIRFRHSGNVCAGDYEYISLGGVVTTDPLFMPSSGRFLKVYSIILWVTPCALFTLMICIVCLCQSPTQSWHNFSAYDHLQAPLNVT